MAMSKDNILYILNWLIVTVFLMYCWYNTLRYANNKKVLGLSTGSFFGLIVLISTFSIVSADYFGYLKMLDRMKMYSMTLEVEPFYWYYAEFLNYDIFWFRGILLAITYLSLIWIIRNLKLPQSMSYYLVGIFLFYQVATILRSSASDAVMWLGIIPFFHRRSLATIITLIITIALGIILHKSAFMVIALLMVAFVPLKKSLIQLSILLLPVGIIILRVLIPKIFGMFFENSIYLEAEKTVSMIGTVKQIVTMLFTAVFTLFVLWKSRKYVKNSSGYKYIYNTVYWAYYLWVMFLFGGASRFIGERLYAHALIPLLILIVILFANSQFRVKRQLVMFFLINILITQLAILVVWAYHAPLLQLNKYITIG